MSTKVQITTPSQHDAKLPVISRVFAYSGGKAEVRIGDVFDWDGIGKGRYEVMSFGDVAGHYSPSGLGGTGTVFVKDENGKIYEWCGDSVAAGVSRGLVKHGL